MTHLGRTADAYGGSPALAAWLHVERAYFLERRLGRMDAARGALERALDLDPGVGPVRDAFVKYVATHGDWAALARLLDEEATTETLDERCARLELDAAIVASARLGTPEWSIRLLERAAARAPTTPFVDRRVLDELVRLYEAGGRWAEAARVRRARLSFVREPAQVAFELRALATLHETLGEVDVAIADLQRALALDGGDPVVADTLDRLLAGKEDHEARVNLWLTEAARCTDGERRARAYGRAADIAERVLRRPADAVKHLQAAWVALPGDPATLEALSRLLSPSLPDAADPKARALVELYTQAAGHALDPSRRVAALEKAALVCEDLLNDAGRAAALHEEILSIEPDRRSSILGLARAAARLGDARLLARALLEEARVAKDRDERLGLSARAAGVLAEVDPARALAQLEAVLAEDPLHAEARALETRLHQDAGRWELAARSLRTRIEAARTSAEAVALWLALARIQDGRLHAPDQALRSLEAARSLDPTHPVPPEEIVRLLETQGDRRALRDALELLATSAPAAEERARHLLRAAEISELHLDDDANAARLYTRALEEVPGEDLVADRLARVLARRAAKGTDSSAEQLELFRQRIERAPSSTFAQPLVFELALLLTDLGHELPRAAALVEALLAEQADHAPALRLLERIARRSGDTSLLARAYALQGDCLGDTTARVGALGALAAREEWGAGADPVGTYRKILALSPGDAAALEGIARRLEPLARADEQAAAEVTAALRQLVPLAPEDGSRFVRSLQLAAILEKGDGDRANEALDAYRQALRADHHSLTAALGVARLAKALGDRAASIEAAKTLAQLAPDPRERAKELVEAAELLLGPSGDERLGTPNERRQRAASMLEEALASDPDCLGAADRLATTLREARQGERLVTVFRQAFSRATTPEAQVFLGTEIARVARDDLQDLPLAIDIVRRVRQIAPSHVPSLLTLAELCIAQRAWPEAVEALEHAVAMGGEVGPRLTALLALASVYEKVLGRPDDVERVLRVALTLDPSNVRALEWLVRHLKARAEDPPPPGRASELMSLMARLAEAEPDPERKTGYLLELGEAYVASGDMQAAVNALVEAVAQSPNHAPAFDRLCALYRGSGSRPEPVAFARALAAVIGRGQQLGRVAARWFATLGRIEVDSLGRVHDGIAHLQHALRLDATQHEVRLDLARAEARAGAHDDAVRDASSLILHDPKRLLSLSEPASALDLLERSLAAARRPDESAVVTELRALAGALDDGRHAMLRARRLPDVASGLLDRPTLVTHVLPSEGRHILLEVAAAVAGIEARLFKGVNDLGVSSRDRARAGHPLRAPFDRIMRQLGLGDVELVVSPATTRVRVVAHDVPWVVVPPTLADAPEPAQLVAIGRALARIAFGVSWLEELPPPHVTAFLVACGRQAVPEYALDDLEPSTASLVGHYETSVARALSRRQRKLLDELAPHIAVGRPSPPEAFVGALTRGEMRTAYVLTGDLLAVIDEVRAIDPALHRATEYPSPQGLVSVLEHPFAGDVARFALTPEATALRQRLGTTW